MALFNNFAVVRASNFMCPSGYAAYYELHVVCMGKFLQWGFCSEALGHQDKYTGHGVGDDKFSWGIDGDRLLKWHDGEHPFGGRQWKEGDVIGLACDLRPSNNHELKKKHRETNDQTRHCGGSIWASLNGDFSPPYGLVFHIEEGFGGLFAAFTSQSGALKCNLGEVPFQYSPPGKGFKPMSSFLRQ
jgi:hypothetical protein